LGLVLDVRQADANRRAVRPTNKHTITRGDPTFGGGVFNDSMSNDERSAGGKSAICSGVRIFATSVIPRPIGAHLHVALYLHAMTRCLAPVFREWAHGCLAIAIVGVAACADGTSSAPNGETGLSDAWSRYKTLSTQHATADRAVVNSELKAIGQSTTTRAAYTDADFKIDGTMTDAWFATPTVAAIADAILSYQTPTGGWSKRASNMIR
jgi:hypothetical protein